jgi:hypothetical protein
MLATVGGVMRGPVGCGSCASVEIIERNAAIQTARGEPLAIRAEGQSEDPIGLPADRAQLLQIRGREKLHRAIGRGRNQRLAIRRERETQNLILVRDLCHLQLARLLAELPHPDLLVRSRRRHALSVG